MIHPESVKQWEAETEYFQGRIGALKAENAKLRAVVVDMLAGLEYLRTTNRVPYGFGIDRLEASGKAALADCLAREYSQTPKAIELRRLRKKLRYAKAKERRKTFHVIKKEPS